MIIFAQYSTELLEYLRFCDNDVSRIDELIASGGTPTFVCSHYRADGGWRKGLSATCNGMPGEYLDEHAQWVNPNEFYEWHGGDRISGGL